MGRPNHAWATQGWPALADDRLIDEASNRILKNALRDVYWQAMHGLESSRVLGNTLAIAEVSHLAPIAAMWVQLAKEET